MPRALIIGGTGAIGRATAARLLTTGWHVDLMGRDPAHMPVGTIHASTPLNGQLARWNAPIFHWDHLGFCTPSI